MFSAVVLASPVRAIAGPAPNAVVEWAGLSQQAIHGPAAPRSAGKISEILHTMVHLAVYDAVVAIEGGSRPFAANMTAAPNADVRAAVATAAYLTARPRIAAAHLPVFDQHVCDWYFANLPADDAVTEGVRVGQLAAAAMLALRANDGFTNVVPYECSGTPTAIGEFVPDTGMPLHLPHVGAACRREGGRHHAVHAEARRRVPSGRTGPARLEGLRARLRRDARLRRGRQHRPLARADRRRLVLGREPVRALEPQSDGAGAEQGAERAPHGAPLRDGPHRRVGRDHRRLRGQVPLSRLASADRDPGG